MGVTIPQVVTASKATGAQVIDGSLKFDQGKTQHLSRTPSSDGNKRTWTWSGWVKPAADALGDSSGSSLFAAYSAANDRDVLRFGGSSTDAVDFQHRRGGSNYGGYTSAKLRDYGGSGWYHIVLAWNDAATIYVNGVQQSLSGVSNDANNGQINNNVIHYIGARSSSGSAERGWDGQMSQVYFIDGEALGPTEFGFTDPLTNTWKPKKYTGDFNIAADSYSTDIGLFTIGNATPNQDSTAAYLNSNPDSATYPLIQSSQSSNNTIRVKFASAQTGVTNIKFRGGGYAASSTYTLFLDGTQFGGTHNTITGWSEDEHTLDAATDITELKIVGSDGFALGQLKFDDTLVSGTVSFGTEATGINSFYLPMDGNSPIGEDKSGNGNNWEPVNFGGSVELDKATGAKPILNTVGGATATVGVFGSRQNIGYAVTVSDASGSNKYYLDGVETPTLTGLIRGATYTFDQTDSSNSTHPLVFGTTANGNNYGIGVSITGSPGSTGITSITIPHNAPDTLYYHCSAHSGMGGSITGITTNEKLADPYASNCVLALPLVGIATDVSTSIACTSHRKNLTTSTVSGSSTANFYNNSMRWSATGSTIDVEEQGDELIFGTGDFTIECWVRDDNGHDGNSNRCYIFDNRAGGSVAGDPPQIVAYVDNHSEWNVYIGNPVVEIVVDVGTSAIVDQWNHFAVTREGSTVRMFVNGVELGSATSSTDFTNDGIGVGRGYDSGYGWAGNIQDFRVYKGVAKYTSDFIPASPNPDILPDTPSGVSGSSKLTKITDGSVSFTGIGATHLPVADSTDFTMGSGDWTMECFAYPQTPDSNQYQSLVQKYATSNSDSSWFWSVYGYTTGYGTQNFYFYRADGTSFTFTGGTAPFPLNQWHHFVATRDGDTIRLYIDGIQDGTIDVTGESMNDTTCDLTIGADSSSNYAMTGMISNVRVITGTCLYPDGKSFTPPTAPLTNVTNTKLLCCQSNTSATEAAVIPDFTNFPAPYSAVAKFGSYKEYTTVNKNVTSATTLPMSNPSHYQGNALDLTSGGFQITTVNSAAEDFFMGMWVHFDTYETGKQFGVDIANNYVYFETQSSGAIKIRHTGDGGSTSSNTSLNDGNWHHIALSRTGDTLYGFVDGTAVVNDSGGLSGNNSVAANSNFNFWGADNNFTSYNIDGQIIDAFIYNGKGVSSYTTPTAPLIGSDGTINHYSGFTDSDAYFISPCIDVTGSDANSITGFFENIAGANTGSATNFNPFTTDINTVRGQETGYATLNPLVNSVDTLSDGNLTSLETTGNHGRARSTITMDTSGTGKFYFEAKLIVVGGNYPHIGVIDSVLNTDANYVGSSTNCFSYFVTGNKQLEGGSASSYGQSFTAGDTIGCSLDCGSGELRFYKNGIDQGVAKTITANYHACFAVSSYSNGKWEVNFGQKPFKFPPPDGFQPLNGANTRLAKVISRPDQYFGVSTYDGNNATRDIQTGFAPDLVFFKSTDSTKDWAWYDSVRGVENRIRTPRDTEGTQATDSSGLTSFNSRGFTMGNSSFNNGDSKSYVAYSFKAGGDSGTFNVDDIAYASASAAGLDGGTLTPSGASVGTEQGFSIIEWEGTNNNKTISHGLSQTPEFIINKNIDTNTDWYVGSPYLSTSNWGKYLVLNTNAADAGNSDVWQQGGQPSATIFGVGSVGNSTGTHIAYVWHSVPGLQKFGTYEGNGSTDGPYVDLGFKPAILILKNVDDAENWYVYDTERMTSNPAYQTLQISSNGSEETGSTNSRVDLLSSGFKLRQTNGPNNSNSYLYAAWAKAPSVDLYGGGANAR